MSKLPISKIVRHKVIGQAADRLQQQGYLIVSGSDPEQRTALNTESLCPPAQSPMLGGIACVAFDYGGTLTSPTAAIAPHLGMRPLDPTVIPALRRLHRWGLRLLVASNTRPHQNRRLALRHAGVEHLFTDVLTSTQLHARKPEPAFYNAVLHAADCPPHRVLFVGNNPTNDVRGPMKHGMRAVLIQPGLNSRHLTDGAHTIGHINDLPDLVETLCT